MLNYNVLKNIILFLWNENVIYFNLISLSIYDSAMQICLILILLFTNILVCIYYISYMFLLYNIIKIHNKKLLYQLYISFFF